MAFVAMFTVLTFVKVFHWLVADRVDYIETTPSVSRLTHARILSFMLILLVRAGKRLQKPMTPVLWYGFLDALPNSPALSTLWELQGNVKCAGAALPALLRSLQLGRPAEGAVHNDASVPARCCCGVHGLARVDCSS